MRVAVYSVVPSYHVTEGAVDGGGWLGLSFLQEAADRQRQRSRAVVLFMILSFGLRLRANIIMYRIRYVTFLIGADLWGVKYPIEAKAFGIRLRQIREKRGLSQQELADLADLSRLTITRFENAQMNPSLDALVGIGRGLEMPLKELVDFVVPDERAAKKRKS